MEGGREIDEDVMRDTARSEGSRMENGTDGGREIGR